MVWMESFSSTVSINFGKVPKGYRRISLTQKHPVFPCLTAAFRWISTPITVCRPAFSHPFSKRCVSLISELKEKIMDVDVDHYNVLGLPSGEEGAKLSEKEISKAYRVKALELHPDKRPDDPQAHANFQKLKTSYEILKDEKARKLFDDLLRVKREQFHRQAQYDVKRRRMVSDLEERERAANAPDPASKAREEEERIVMKLKEEIARIRAMHANKGVSGSRKEATETRKESAAGGGGGLNKEKVLKVSWEKGGEDYTAERLREVFAKFGEVEDVVLKSSKKKGSALVVMASKEAAVAATGNVCGHISNPLLVLPLQPAVGTELPPRSMEPEPSSNLVGAGYQSFEESVLKKLQKAAEKQK